MSDLIDRDALIADVKRIYCTDCNSYNGVRCRACGTGDALDVIDDAITVDAVQVIHCKDCAYYGKSPLAHMTFGWCRIDAKHRSPKFYCANADRKAGRNDE